MADPTREGSGVGQMLVESNETCLEEGEEEMSEEESKQEAKEEAQE